MADRAPSPRGGCLAALIGALVGAVMAPIGMIVVVIILASIQDWFCNPCLEGVGAALYILTFLSPVPGALLGMIGAMILANRRRPIR